jgi:hypothetical protein
VKGKGVATEAVTFVYFVDFFCMAERDGREISDPQAYKMAMGVEIEPEARGQEPGGASSRTGRAGVRGVGLFPHLNT